MCLTPKILACTPLSCANTYFRRDTSPKHEENILVTELVDNDGHRTKCPQMTEAKSEEIWDLLKGGTFTAVLKEYVPFCANTVLGRFLLAIKSKPEGKVK